MEDSWTFGHIGITVKDIDKAIKYYQSLGATLIDGPAMPDFDLSGWRFYGNIPTNIKTKSCHVQMGSLIFEIHQPVEGESPWTEYLQKHGEGVDHINYFVDDVKKETEKMVKKGFKVVLSITEPGDKWVGVFLDTRQGGNYFTELSNRGLVDANKATWNK
jgi:methylmalonyl-CoA/ethylmalonyl-CoA epimerase